MRTKLFSNDAKRKSIAREVSACASEAMGQTVSLERGADSDLYRDEYKFRLEGIETERGPVAWVAVDVSPLGIDIHTRFDFPQFAPAGANRHSGKWNHYITPREGESRADYLARALPEVESILREVRPIDAVRHDRPGRADIFAHYIKEMSVSPEKVDA